jgi:hypothetical protein
VKHDDELLRITIYVVDPYYRMNCLGISYFNLLANLLAVFSLEYSYVVNPYIALNVRKMYFILLSNYVYFQLKKGLPTA